MLTDTQILLRFAQILMEMVPGLDPMDAIDIAFLVLEEVANVDYYGT